MAGEAEVEVEVEELGVAVLREEDFLGLEVSVDDPLLVRGGEAFGGLAGDLEARLTGTGPRATRDRKGRGPMPSAS